MSPSSKSKLVGRRYTGSRWSRVTRTCREQTVTMTIDTGDANPIRLKPYRTPLNKTKLMDKAVDDMLAAGLIERSWSPWSFPVVVVDKKDEVGRPMRKAAYVVPSSSSDSEDGSDKDRPLVPLV